MHFSGAAEWRELTKQWFLSYLFCIIPLHVSLEQIYLERQLTLKEILPLEEVCLYFVYSPAWILNCCLFHKWPCTIWTRMIWYDLSLSTAPATFFGRCKVLRGHKVGHGVLRESCSLAHKRGFVFRLQFEAGFISLIRSHHHNLKIAGSNILLASKVINWPHPHPHPYHHHHHDHYHHHHHHHHHHLNNVLLSNHPDCTSAGAEPWCRPRVISAPPGDEGEYEQRILELAQQGYEKK